MCFNSIETSIRLKENLATEVCKHQMKKLGYNLQRPLFNLCQESNTLFTEAINGFKQGITQCNRSFGRMRWNCTNQSTGKINVLFGIVMARGKAFFSSFKLYQMFCAKHIVGWVLTLNNVALNKSIDSHFKTSTCKRLNICFGQLLRSHQFVNRPYFTSKSTYDIIIFIVIF